MKKDLNGKELRRPLVEELELQRRVLEKLIGKSSDEFKKEIDRADRLILVSVSLSTLATILSIIGLCQVF